MDLSPVTVLVGPNNGGKSTALNDLMDFANRGDQFPLLPWQGGKVIRDAQITLPATQAEVLSFLKPRMHGSREKEILLRNFGLHEHQGVMPGIVMDSSASLNPEELDPDRGSPEKIALKILGLYTVSLGGRQRFELTTGRTLGRLDKGPTSHWMAVAQDENIYREVDGMIFAAFGKHLVFQYLQPPHLEPALSASIVPPELRLSMSKEALVAQELARPLSEFSDGVQIYCGLVSAVAALPHILILIDEPEAFLHPLLSRRLGADLARIAKERDARLVAATHSSDFLLGCLEEVPESSVVRLSYQSEVASSHFLTAAQVAILSRDPLLRSADALQALFGRSAVVCESDNDRAFYEEINRRLQNSKRNGALDCDFLNAQNWQTTWRLAHPLRLAGIPTAVILDLDVLTQDDVWSELVAMGQPSNEERNHLLDIRVEAREAILECGYLSDSDKAPLRVKVKGLAALDHDQRQIVEAALRAFSEVGIFLVDAGELENWLPQFGCTNKKTWVTDIFQRLGALGDGAYVSPGDGDVWLFMERVSTWLEGQNRKGMPF